MEKTQNLFYADVLLELSPNLVIFLDQDSLLFQMNNLARSYFLKDTSDVYIGKNIFELIKNPVLVHFFKKWLEKLNKGIEVDETFPFDRQETGQYDWFQLRAKNVEHDGRLVGKAFFFSDVTELYSQKKILDTLMSSLPGEVLVFDRSFRILLVSDSLARQNGYHSWRDVSGRTLHDLPKLDLSYVETLLDKIILTDEPIHEVCKYTKEIGDACWMYIDIRTIKSTAGIFGYILTQLDITGEIRPKAILEALMESSSDAITILNPEGVVQYASKLVAHTLGFPDWHSAIGHPWSYLFRNMDQNNSGFTELFSGDPRLSRQGTLSVRGPDGTMHFNYRVDPLTYQNENFGSLSIATDTTALVETRDRAESAVRAKAAFLANMSHELRTPMNAVLGMNELLSRSPLTQLQKSYSSFIRSSATLLLSIINDILDLSRIEDWKLELNKAPYKTISLFQDVVNQVTLKAVEKELSFIVELDPEIPSTLIGDELRVKQILINILNNAVKFTNQGEIRLSVSVSQASSRNSVSLVLRVKDTGIGIPKARQRELFERFARIENKHAFVTEGTGLGLSICKGLVSLMHGSLSVESDEGVGSVFTARILQEVSGDKEPIASFRALSTSSMLVYEADLPTLELIKGMCARAGVKHEACGDVRSFIECLEDKNFAWSHVIFEYKKGYSEVLKVSGRHSSVKWLALLSMADFIETGRAPEIDFIFKPFLITTFARFLRGDRVDFSGSFPLSNALGLAPAYFSAHGVRVLVVDDSTVNRKVAEGFLKTLDITVEEAESGIEAIEKVGKAKYDIIFLDHLMPDMDGMETASRIRSLPGCKHVPIIALTANASEANGVLYRKAGMSDCIAKPIDFNAFVVCLKKWLPADKRMDTEAVPRKAESVSSASVEEWIPGLDREAGLEYTGSVENLEKILELFEKTAPKMLDTLESARRSGNSAQFRSAVHALISSCANIGGTRLSFLARELEQSIIGGKTQDVDRLYPEVHSEMGLIIAGIKTHIYGIKGDKA